MSPYRALFGVQPRQPNQPQQGQTMSERMIQMWSARNSVESELKRSADAVWRRRNREAKSIPELHPGDMVLMKTQAGPAMQSRWNPGWIVRRIQGPVVDVEKNQELRRVNRERLRLAPPKTELVELSARQYRRQKRPQFECTPGPGLKLAIRRVDTINSEWSQWLAVVSQFCS